MAGVALAVVLAIVAAVAAGSNTKTPPAPTVRLPPDGTAPEQVAISVPPWTAVPPV